MISVAHIRDDRVVGLHHVDFLEVEKETRCNGSVYFLEPFAPGSKGLDL